MKKITILILLFVASLGFTQSKVYLNKLKFNSKNSSLVLAKRKQHEQFLACSPFKKSLNMTEEERMDHGLPPNKYFEENWELTMNPTLGYPTTDKVNLLREQLEFRRQQALSFRTPGDAVDNLWVERGPNNVGGRTRGLLFDPNDPTNETVFAGSVSGGLWKNTNISNASSNWSRVNIPDNLTVSCIVVDPNNSSVFYIGTGESYTGDVSGDGVWKSIDAGLTWTRILGGQSGPAVYNSSAPLTVNSPSIIAGNYATSPTTAFGNAVTTGITANLVLVSDGTLAPTEACNPPLINTSALAGKIALIRRGNCTFVTKVKAAQDAGAIGVIMMNNVSGAPAGMGGTDATITIPSFAISQADGNLLEASLNAGNTVNVTLNPSLPGQFSGYNVPGIQAINDIKIRNNSGVSELYVAVGDTYNYAYIGANNYGMYKTTNGGATWTTISLPPSPSGNRTDPNDISIGADNQIWVSTTNSWTFGDGGGRVLSSMDGINFTTKYTVPSGKRVQIEASKSTANKVYLLSEIPLTGTSETLMLKTTDGFSTTSNIILPTDCYSSTRFSTYGFTGQQAFYDLLMSVDPLNDQTIYIGGIDLFKSTDGGSSWTQISETNGSCGSQVHSDQHVIAFGNNNSSKVAFGGDGGVYFSSSSGTSISSRNRGYNVTQFYGVAVAPVATGLTGDYFVSGAQDNGTQYFANPGPVAASSVTSQGGDGGITLFDQGIDKYYISNYVYNDNVNYRSTAGTVRTLSDGSSGYGAFIAPMALDSNKDVLYSDYSNTAVSPAVYQIRRYLNVKSGTVARLNLTNALLTNSPTALTVSKYTTASTKLYVGTRVGKLLLVTTANAGTVSGSSQVWSDISAGSGFVGSISDVELGNSESQIFVTMHNYGVVSVWYTADGGTTWENKEGDLPDMPVKCILRNPLNTEEVILGTELGVWYTNNFSSAYPNWRPSFNGMTNVKVTDLDLRDDNAVYASTYGRGVFSGQFTAPSLSNTEFETKYGIKVYPNPSNNGLFNLSMKDFSSKLNIQVTDLNGRLVYDAKNIDFNTEKSIDLSAVQSGVYILKINSDEINFSKKIIKN
jgi:PA domain/Secretion system C-terminal sorting domain